MKRKYEVIGIVIDNRKEAREMFHFISCIRIVKLKTLQKLLIFLGGEIER